MGPQPPYGGEGVGIPGSDDLLEPRRGRERCDLGGSAFWRHDRVQHTVTPLRFHAFVPKELEITFGGGFTDWLTAIASVVVAVAAMAALRQLAEARSDRHVAVLLELGRRWEEPPMTEALTLSRIYGREGLRRLFTGDMPTSPFKNPLKERQRQRVIKHRLLLLHVPNYYEDSAMVAQEGLLKEDSFVENFGGVAIDDWELWDLAIAEMRTRTARAYDEFEALARKAQERDVALEEREAVSEASGSS